MHALGFCHFTSFSIEVAVILLQNFFIFLGFLGLKDFSGKVEANDFCRWQIARFIDVGAT